MAKSVTQIREMMKQIKDPSLFEESKTSKKESGLVNKINQNNLYVSSSIIYSNMLQEEHNRLSTPTVQEEVQSLTEDSIKLAGALYAMKEVLTENITKENSVKLFQEINKIYKKI